MGRAQIIGHVRPWQIILRHVAWNQGPRACEQGLAQERKLKVKQGRPPPSKTRLSPSLILFWSFPISLLLLEAPLSLSSSIKWVFSLSLLAKAKDTSLSSLQLEPQTKAPSLYFLLKVKGSPPLHSSDPRSHAFKREVPRPPLGPWLASGKK